MTTKNKPEEQKNDKINEKKKLINPDDFSILGIEVPSY